MLSKKVKPKAKAAATTIASTYSERYFAQDVPKHEMPENGMPSEAAGQIVRDELNLDGNPALNLAGFVTTWMEREAQQLVTENLARNFIDHDEYPQTEVIHEYCVNMLARLFNAPEEKTAIGTSTIGSSEAIMLGLMSAKWQWKKRRQAAGKPIDRPNIVMGAEVHTCWDKFARYFEVEPRIVPMARDRYAMTADEVEALLDENTICVGAVLGTTFTGQIDPVRELSEMLDAVHEKKGWDIPIHVDAASGGFITPFTEPDLEWDFRLPRVKSINVSGHKYGLVYPGLGWLIFRDESDLAADLVFKVNYLGGEMDTYTLNFSRGGSTVLAQYYNLIRLGKSGYRQIMTNIMENARWLAKLLSDSGRFEMLNSGEQMPVIVFRLKDGAAFSVYDVSHKLRERGWIVPAYTMPPNAEDVAVLRVVVKENFSRDMAEMLAADVEEACVVLEAGHDGGRAVGAGAAVAPATVASMVGKKHRHGVC